MRKVLLHKICPDMLPASVQTFYVQECFESKVNSNMGGEAYHRGSVKVSHQAALGLILGGPKM